MNLERATQPFQDNIIITTFASFIPTHDSRNQNCTLKACFETKSLLVCEKQSCLMSSKTVPLSEKSQMKGKNF